MIKHNQQTTSEKVEFVLKPISITLIFLLFCVALPLRYINNVVEANHTTVTYEEWIDNNVNYFVKTHPNRNKYLSFVKLYRTGDAEKITDTIIACAYHNDIDPTLLFAIAASESSFNQNAVSRVGAKGIMQVMPFWKKLIGNPNDNLHDMQTNVDYGVRILRMYLSVENGDVVKALARYNGSKGSTKYPNKILKQSVWKM